MVRPLVPRFAVAVRFAAIGVAALIVLTASLASAAGPQPDPPAFGMFGINQLRFWIQTVPPPSGERDSCGWLQATVQVDNADGHAPTLTLSPSKTSLSNPSQIPVGGRRGEWHGLGPIAIGFGHTARLNAVNIGTGDGIRCQVSWTLLNGDGKVLSQGTSMIQGGQAIHTDFSHTDPSIGLAQIRAEVTVNGDTSRSCPSDTTIGTLEGFDSTLGHSHTIVPVQLILPAKL